MGLLYISFYTSAIVMTSLNWISVPANSKVDLETNKPLQGAQEASSPEKRRNTVDGVRLAQDSNQSLDC
jgi:hypothetical protein